MSTDARLIAARYVQALFDLATQEQAHDAVKADMLVLKSVYEGSDELRKLLSSPVITREDSQQAIAKVLAATQASELTRKFFALLARNRRLSVTPLAIDAYLQQLAASRGELTVQVTTAQPLGEDEKKELIGVIATSTGKKIALKTAENPALLGGLQVRIGSRMLDNSVAGKLARLKQVMNAA